MRGKGGEEGEPFLNFGAKAPQTLWQALTAAMYSALRSSLRPRRGFDFFRIVQLLFSMGATPAILAMPLDVNDPMSGQDDSIVPTSTGPTPTTCSNRTARAFIFSSDLIPCLPYEFCSAAFCVSDVFL